MTQAQVEQFFSTYRDAFNALDGDAVADLWHVPCGIAHGDAITWWADEAPMRHNHRALCEHYRQAGYGRADFAIVHHEPLGELHDFVRIAWRLIRSDGQPLQAFGTAYQLLGTPAGPRVFLCTAFEENLREMKTHAAV